MYSSGETEIYTYYTNQFIIVPSRIQAARLVQVYCIIEAAPRRDYDDDDDGDGDDDNYDDDDDGDDDDDDEDSSPAPHRFEYDLHIHER